jgi:hypothetical protein
VLPSSVSVSPIIVQTSLRRVSTQQPTSETRAPSPTAPSSASTPALPHPAPDGTNPTIAAFLASLALSPALGTRAVVRRFVDAGISDAAALTALARLREREPMALLRRDLGLNVLEARVVRAGVERWCAEGRESEDGAGARVG